MELPGTEVHHIVHFLPGNRGGPGRAAFPGGIVDLYARLAVVDIDAEANLIVLHGQPLHQNAAGDQLAAFKDRGDTIEDVICRFLYIVGHHVFKGEHPLHVQVARAGDEVAFVGVFAGELVTDEMAAVIEIFSVHIVVFCRLPAGGPHLPDAAALLRGHQLLSHAGIGHAAAPLRIQLAVMLKSGGGVIRLGEVRLVAVYGRIGLTAVFRDLCKGEAGSFAKRGGRGCRRPYLQSAAGQKQQTGEERREQSFHLV